MNPRQILGSLGSLLPPAFLLLALFLGGASGVAAGSIANAVLQAVSAVAILVSLWRARKDGLPAEARPLLWLISFYLVFVALSLIPLPADTWRGLPGREAAARGLALVGIPDASLPHTLSPQGTLSSLPWLLPPLAMLLLTLRSGNRDRKKLAYGLLVGAILSVGLGVAQLLSGVGSGLRFYQITNPNLPVGFFANANHLATLLLCALPFAGYIAAQAARRGHRARRVSGISIGVSIGLFLAIGIGIIGSLAGYGLLLVTAAVTVLIYRRAAFGRVGLFWLLGVAIAFASFVALAVMLQEQAVSGKLSDERTSRKVMAATTVEAIKDTFPAGTGLGSFSVVYRTYEDQRATGREYVNHAHNDYLEFLLEFGAAGLIMLLWFLAWLGLRVVHIWRSTSEGADRGRAASVVILVELMHSIVDFPIRTSAIAAVVALACGLMIAHKGRERRRQRPDDEAESGELRHLEAD